VEAMEENITAETRAHCTCMVAATAVEEKSGVAVARVAMVIGFGTRAAAGTMAHWQLDPGWEQPQTLPARRFLVFRALQEL